MARDGIVAVVSRGIAECFVLLLGAFPPLVSHAVHRLGASAAEVLDVVAFELDGVTYRFADEIPRVRDDCRPTPVME